MDCSLRRTRDDPFARARLAHFACSWPDLARRSLVAADQPAVDASSNGLQFSAPEAFLFSGQSVPNSRANRVYCSVCAAKRPAPSRNPPLSTPAVLRSNTRRYRRPQPCLDHPCNTEVAVIVSGPTSQRHLIDIGHYLGRPLTAEHHSARTGHCRLNRYGNGCLPSSIDILVALHRPLESKIVVRGANGS